ncbi:uncharacterized protein LOC144433000 [Glandiceps talaboti]
MKPPYGLMGEGLLKNCQGVKVLHFDDRSRIGATTLGWADYLCRCGFNKDESWGGLPVVVSFGDDIQLPPVLDSPVYISKGKTPAAMRGVLVWKEFKDAVTLNTIVRQSASEEHFK